jgi:hypothetical protein
MARWARWRELKYPESTNNLSKRTRLLGAIFQVLSGFAQQLYA